MTVKLTSYVNLNGNAAQALDFYQSIFGGTVDSDTFGGFNEKSGNAMPVPPEDNDKIMHATLTTDNFELMVSDYPSSWTDTPSVSNITLTLNGDDESVLRGYWDKLIVDGTIQQPLEVAEWGDMFGSVTDKFGVSWMFDIAPSK
ncbi:MAG: VOC family protein [Chloroflexi bacterium]|nr:MAG: VOC family protein [Chloroflexota bacterium]